MEVRGGGGVGFGGRGAAGCRLPLAAQFGQEVPGPSALDWGGAAGRVRVRGTPHGFRYGFTPGGNLTISATGGRPKGKPKNEQRRPGKPNRLRRCSLLPATGRRDCNRNRESHVDREGKANYFFFLAAAFFAAGFFAAAFFAAAFLATVGSSS
jgi:hypothetical protein